MVHQSNDPGDLGLDHPKGTHSNSDHPLSIPQLVHLHPDPFQTLKKEISYFVTSEAMMIKRYLSLRNTVEASISYARRNCD